MLCNRTARRSMVGARYGCARYEVTIALGHLEIVREQLPFRRLAAGSNGESFALGKRVSVDMGRSAASSITLAAFICLFLIEGSLG